MKRTPVRHGGFAIVSAIFLLIALAALGGYMATVGGVQYTTVLLSMSGTRAHFAAHGGLEWAISDIVNNGAAGLNCAPGSTSFTVTGFSVTVTCTAQPVTEGSDNYTVYNLESTATRGSLGEPGFASRTIVATVAF